MTLAEHLTQQGLQPGIQQGWQQGVQEAVADILETRFGDMFTPSLKKKLKCITDQTALEILLQKAVTVDTLAELEEEIASYLS